jgi:hypothetical protein
MIVFHCSKFHFAFKLPLGLVAALLVSTGLLHSAQPVNDGSRMIGDLKVTKPPLDRAGLLPCMVWADAEGSAFFTLRGDTGLLQRVSFPDFKVTKKKDLERKFTWVSMSGQGLLLTCNEAEEIWVVDPGNLEVKAKIDVPKLKRAASAPGLHWAVACDEPAKSSNPFQEKLGSATVIGLAPTVPPGGFGAIQKLYVIDLAKKKIEPANAAGISLLPKIGSLSDQAGSLGAVDNPVVSPNGAFVFTQYSSAPSRGNNYIPTVFRFAFKDGKLKFEGGCNIREAHDEDPAASASGIVVSPDSKLVALPSPPSASVGLTMPSRTIVFPADNLKKINGTLEQGSTMGGIIRVKPVSLGFDPKSAYCYVESTSHALAIFTSHGIKKKEYTFEKPDQPVCDENGPTGMTRPWQDGDPDGVNGVQQYLVHPGGSQIVMLTGAGIYSVTLPKLP